MRYEIICVMHTADKHVVLGDTRMICSLTSYCEHAECTRVSVVTDRVIIEKPQGQLDALDFCLKLLLKIYLVGRHVDVLTLQPSKQLKTFLCKVFAQ